MFLLTITSRRGAHELWCQTHRQLWAVNEKSAVPDPASVPLSKPGEASGLSDRSITSAAVTLRTLVTALCEKKAPLCGRERPSIVRVCLGSWRGEAKSWQRSYGTSPNRATMFNGKNKSLLCHTLRNTVGCSVTLSLTTGHSALLPSRNLCQLNVLALSAAALIRCRMIRCRMIVTRDGICWIYFGQKVPPIKGIVQHSLSFQECCEKINISLGAEAVRRFA